jgi:polyhydroxyalkanoate synthesis repressor PhaR
VEPRADGSAREPRIIKRYANRKLYDTRDSRYVTLQQIAEYVRDGEDVRIVDNKTKEDLTNVTLAQIIYEEEKKGEGDVRRSTLKSLIEEGRDRLVGSLPGPLSKLLHRDEPADEAKADDEGEPKKKSSTPKEALEELRATADDRVKAVIGAAMGHVQQLQGEVKRLQGRIEELEARLAGLIRREPKEDSAKSDAPKSDDSAE